MDMADQMWDGCINFNNKRYTTHVKNINITIFFTTDDSVYNYFKKIFHSKSSSHGNVDKTGEIYYFITIK